MGPLMERLRVLESLLRGVLFCMGLHCQGPGVPQWVTFLMEGQALAGLQQAPLTRRAQPASFRCYYTQQQSDRGK